MLNVILNMIGASTLLPGCYYFLTGLLGLFLGAVLLLMGAAHQSITAGQIIHLHAQIRVAEKIKECKKKMKTLAYQTALGAALLTVSYLTIDWEAVAPFMP